MQHKWIFLFTGLIIFSLILSPVGMANAQGSTPPTPPAGGGGGKPGGPQRLPNGLWIMPEGAQNQLQVGKQDATLLSTGGPDNFGYTWADTGTFSWVDTTSGTDTGMSGDSDGQGIGPVALPFSFKYYQNTYSSLYIAASGYLSFTDNGDWDSQDEIPNPSSPNNVIAPYWSPFTIGSGSWVHYSSGGSAPNRYFVVEWHDVKDSNNNNFRFEAILLENGDIRFQYHTMPLSMYWCAGMGIEDSTGLDGLMYMDFCDIPPSSSKDVHFYRPAPSARLRIQPEFQARFSTAGALESFQVIVENTGELGADTYDLSISSTWSVSLYAANGVTLLTDTDADGTVDTGSVPQGGSATITIKVQTPGEAVLGDSNTAIVTAQSSLNTGKSKTASLQTTIPAPFAQIYRDDADGAMSLYQVQPSAQTVSKATSDGYYGNDMTVAVSPNGNFVYGWRVGDCLDITCDNYYDDIEYTLLDHSGLTVRGVSKLTNNSGATMTTEDYSPSIAVAPNGAIGFLWTRYLYNSSTSRFNYNIYFATLDASGNLVSGPVNITNNAVWSIDSDLNIPNFYNPAIAASDDNRFILSWEKYVDDPSYMDNIWYAIRDTVGTSIFAPAALTSDNNSWSPILNSLTGGKAILTWNSGSVPTYAVLNSNGAVSKTATSFGVSDVWYTADAVLLPNGSVAVAWPTYTGAQFAILNASYNSVIGPTTLDNPAALSGNADISVTADINNHIILTWMDEGYSNRQNLYYALVDGTGSILTAPMTFRRSQGSYPYIETSDNGQGNAPFTRFVDVSLTYWAGSWIERLATAGITGGCGGGNYCPETAVSRGQMAVFLERGMNSSSYTPPAATGTVFGDVPTSYWSASWVEKLFADGITGGCGGGNYCPDLAVSRAQMAVFLLRAKHGSSYTPPPATGVFPDVPTSYWAAPWIEQLYAESITGGCGGGNYCPDQSVTRGQMAVFLVRTFSLP
jgi:hypothetical protein